jgi:PilZ domain
LMHSQFKPAKAEDVSADGLSMICAELLHDGDLLEVRFTLPSKILAIYPDAAKERRRPFEEMFVPARIVRVRVLGPGKFMYGISLIGIDSYQREELARYVSAVSLSRNHH